MDFELDSDQRDLRDALRGLLADTYSSSQERRAIQADDPGFSEKVWLQLAQMGVIGLPFAEELGGMGAGPVEIGLVAEEFGRVLAPEPFVEAVVLAGGLVAAIGTPEQQEELLGGLAQGSLVPAFAHAEPGAGWSHRAQRVRAEQTADGWTLSGVKEPVPTGGRAQTLIVSAATSAGTELFVVDGESASRRSYPTADGSRAARIDLEGVAASPLGAPGVDRTPDIERAMAQAHIAYCREAVGAMERVLWITVDYLKTRHQFGVPLSTFQALKFRAADMYVRLELARSVALWATLVLDAGGAEANVIDAATRAALQVATAGRHIGQEAVQLHGGIAMTEEYSAGHYLARLETIVHLLGDRTHQLRRLGESVSGHASIDPLAYGPRR